ncbi:MAG TPA: NAD-dependent epimerase/dehydratase family protein, partial [Acidimicrobiia bacterium]|nr:NAD-dependent epimerase/dehydratase family protein [Acidimicrobiia bacterium]
MLVTGGAGFIGSHIVDALLDGGAEVRVVDRIDPPVDDARIDFIAGDLADPAVARRATAGVDAVCHQAAKVGLGVDFGDVTPYVADNDTATAVLLDALWRQGSTARLVLASSMVVYGEGLARCPDHGPVRPAARAEADLAAGRWEPRCRCGRPVTWMPVDETAPADPRNIYAATKLHQEHLCSLWGRAAGATVVAL